MSADGESLTPRRVHNGGFSTDGADPEMVRALARRILRPLREQARDMGYALGVHGSLERDIDLIAVPWAEGAKPVEQLVERLRRTIDRLYPIGLEVGPNTSKPHGRLCWSWWIRPWTYIDLSVLPPASEEPAE